METDPSFWSPLLLNTAKMTLRSLRRESLYTLINILGLWLGISSFLVLGLYVNSELSYDKHHEYHDRIYRVVNEFLIQGRGEAMALSSRALGPLLQRDNPELIDAYTRFRSTSLDLRSSAEHGANSANWDDVFISDPNVFQVFTHNIIHGNPQNALEDPTSIAVSQSFARSYFGDENPVGEILSTGVEDYRVTLVFEDIADNSHLKYDALISMNRLNPMPEDEATLNRLLTDAGFYSYFLVNKSSSGGRFGEILDRLAEERIAPAIAEIGLPDTSMRFWAQKLDDIHLSSTVGVDEPTGNIAYSIGFTVIALLILVTACINYINLSTSRFLKQARETGIRKVLGASRSQLIRRFLGESILFIMITFLLSLIFVDFISGLSIFENFLGRALPASILFSPAVFVSILGLMLMIGLAAGMYPALYLSSVAPSAAFAARGRHIKTGSGILRQLLVLAQFTVSISVIATVLLMANQLQYIANMPLGFDKANKLLVNLRGADLVEAYPAIRNELLTDTNIDGVSMAENIPGDRMGAYGLRVENDNGQFEIQMLIVMRVGSEFIDTMGIPLLQGRGLSAETLTDAPNAIVVNQAMADRMAWRQPIDKQIRGFISGRVVGVSEDFNFASLHQEVVPLMMVGLDNDFAALSEVQRSRITRTMVLNINPERREEVLNTLASLMARFDPVHPFEFELLDTQLNQLYEAEEKALLLIALFSVVCVFISCLGLFGLASYTAEQRTRELGIRKVLGASALQLFWLLSRNLFILTMIAAVIAPLGAYPAFSQWLESFAYRAAIDLLSYPLATLIVLSIALATVSLQLISRVRANPVEALRYE